VILARGDFHDQQKISSLDRSDLFWPAFASTNDKKTVTVAVDNSCPYTCLNSDFKGIFIDAIEQILPAKGYQISYVYRPWKRAIAEFSRTQIDILPAAAALSFPQGLNSRDVLLTESVCFYARPDLSFSYHGFGSLKGFKIGWLQYDHEIPPYDPLYEFDQVKDDFNLYVIQPTLDDSVDRSLQLLASGRIDLLLFNRSIMYFQKQHSAYKSALQGVREVGCLTKNMDLGYVIADHSAESAEIVTVLDRGLKRFKAGSGYK